jgi:hypothetical protein
MDKKLAAQTETATNEPAKLLAAIVLLTQEMLDLAQTDHWDEVTSREKQRQTLLSDCFAHPIPDAQSHLFSEALAAMLAMNEEMIGLLETAKENVAIKRTDQRYKKRSLGHYLDIEESH